MGCTSKTSVVWSDRGYNEAIKLHVTINTKELAIKINNYLKYTNDSCNIIYNLKNLNKEATILETCETLMELWAENFELKNKRFKDPTQGDREIEHYINSVAKDPTFWRDTICAEVLAKALKARIAIYHNVFRKFKSIPDERAYERYN